MNQGSRSVAKWLNQDDPNALHHWQLVTEAQELVSIYRHVAGRTPTPEELPAAALAIGRALEALDSRHSRECLDRAAQELAAARETLTRIRQLLHR